ncbi:hypothetical protein [unidentified bacterial endosymbiont]|uniref:hypothetical protein n=1 Tax=unidentified bacterial endosymbiont TaxID=2355 RepID=UPI0020A01F66|nr:hypothetical protein [unidentified bacterial endosymbiont]
METIHSLLPAQMTPEQRCLAIAAILATGLCRLRAKNSGITPDKLTERQVLLGFRSQPSVHRGPATLSPKEPA